MKNLIILIICILLSGCVSLEVSNDNNDVSPYISQPKQNIFNKIKIGMSLREVQEIVNSNKNIIGYKKNTKTGTFEKIVIKNPYRSELIYSDKSQYLVNYYFTGVKNPDGIISDEELIPIIFKDKIVTGKGRDYLFALKNQ